MSILVSTAIEQLQLETSTVGQRISETDWLLFLNRANKYFMTSYKMPTTEREYNLLVYPSVIEYSLPSDFIGMKEIKRPFAFESPNFEHVGENEFVHWRNGNLTSFKYNRETRFLNVNYTEESSTQIHNFDDTDENGTWAIAGDGSNLSQDKTVYFEGSGSLRFTLTGAGGTTTLTNSTFNAVDLTDYLNKGAFFLELLCPSSNTSSITSIRLRIGTDAGNYYQITATTRFRGDNINAGRGLIGFDWANATTVGSPTITSISYAQIHITNPVANVNGTYYIDNLFVANPTYFQLPYFSLYNIKTNGSSYQESVTATSDTILCPEEFNEAITYKTLELASVYKLQNNGLANYASRELEPKEKMLKMKYPSEEVKVKTKWYKNADKF